MIFVDNLIIKSSKLKGTIRPPSSKSYTHRALCLSLLSDSPTSIVNPLFSRDTGATLTSCINFGAQILDLKSTIDVTPPSVLSNPGELNVENSGTTLRFLTSISALVPRGEVILNGDDSIQKRPMTPLINSLNDLGVSCHSLDNDGTPPIVVEGGGIKGGNTEISGSVSSQFISSLLISCSRAETETSIKLLEPIVSGPYIDSTLFMINKFGGLVTRTNNMFKIEPSKYSCKKINIPSDFSAAAFLFAGALLSNGEVTVIIDGQDLPQADRNILNIISQMGALVETNSNNSSFTVSSEGTLNGGTFDLSSCPDLLPVVSVLSLISSNSVKITGIGHTKYKESNRLKLVASELSKTGANVVESEDSLIIDAPTTIKSCKLNSYDDHRLFMAFSLIGLNSEEVEVSGLKSIDVSYPNFIEDIRALSGRLVFN
ncbi:MAG: 3-phosphoshikimate 1-carboxyvinyltransferase [Thaumarchaeota archaeon]|nr:3-phosphoshikimate 1-carboxyvinyltransferase [Nitrososphaerota archaeon]